MNKKELENEIMKTQEQLEALRIALSKLKETEKEVPETLDICEDDKYYFVDGTGDLTKDTYIRGYSYDEERLKRHRAFLSEEYAEVFAKKTQFIADMLHFKYLYDRDYEPNWDAKDELKFFVYYNTETKKFDWSFVSIYEYFESVYFSTRELAKRCADWLNKRMKENA